MKTITVVVPTYNEEGNIQAIYDRVQAIFNAMNFGFSKSCFHGLSQAEGTAAIIVGIFFVGAVQLFFLGFLGEYILNINIRTMNHPIVVEEERINWKRETGEHE